MPTYTFRLWDDSGGVADDLGLGLANTKAAYSYARDVALELMDQTERFWQCAASTTSCSVEDIAACFVVKDGSGP